jgi:hypothetical protein
MTINKGFTPFVAIYKLSVIGTIAENTESISAEKISSQIGGMVVTPNASLTGSAY